jgi:hypothetical protein
MSKKPGRPPAGNKPGEKVSSYPQVSVRMPPPIKAKLDAIGAVQRKPKWRVMAEAIELKSRDLTPDEQERLAEILGNDFDHVSAKR